MLPFETRPSAGSTVSLSRNEKVPSPQPSAVSMSDSCPARASLSLLPAADLPPRLNETATVSGVNTHVPALLLAPVATVPPQVPAVLFKALPLKVRLAALPLMVSLAGPETVPDTLPVWPLASVSVALSTPVLSNVPATWPAIEELPGPDTTCAARWY